MSDEANKIEYSKYLINFNSVVEKISNSDQDYNLLCKIIESEVTRKKIEINKIKNYEEIIYNHSKPPRKIILENIIR